MKKLILPLLAVATFWSSSTVRAFTYADENLLLIFRKPGYNNVEFNLGTVSNFLNRASGYTATVTNFNLNLVTSTLGTLSDDVRIILIASTDKLAASKRAWLGSAEPNTQPLDRTSSQWQNLWSQISGIGVGAQNYTGSNATQSAVIPTGNLYSFDFIATGGGLNANGLPYLNSYSTFAVEQAIPGSLKFWEVHPSTVTPKPNATLIGTFSITSAGELTFVAGSAAVATPPVITGVTRNAGVTAVTFTTISGGTYQLRYTNVLSGTVSNWPAVGTTVTGDGASKTLTHTNASGGGFYGVSRSP